MARVNKKANFVNGFLVGCDPEMVVLHKNARLCELSEKMSKEGTVGWDHGGRVLEIRPEPTKGTYTLVKHIQSIINTNPKLDAIREKAWRAGAVVTPAGGVQESLGGHVCLDLNPNNQVQKQRVAALDLFTQTLERLDILPAGGCEIRRRNFQYGKYSDIRVKGTADRPRFEYRTMPSWLYDARVAFLCLTGAKLAAVEPKLALEMLKNPDAKSLRAFFEAFKARDINAARVVEKVPLPFKVDPEADVQEAWKGKLSF